MKRQRVLALAISLAAIAALSTGPAAADAGPAPTPWIDVPHSHISGQDSHLFDVTAVGPGDIWSIGYRFTVIGGAFEFRTNGQHCVNSVCTQANLPDREAAPATDFLYGIGAASPSDIWTVGYSRAPGAAGVTLAIHYNGTSWSIVNTPNPVSNSSVLYAVATASPTLAVAVGTSQNPSNFAERPLAMRWNGSVWSLTPVTIPAGCSPTSTAVLTDVAKVQQQLMITGYCVTTAGVEAGFVIATATGAAWNTLVGPGDGLLPTGSRLNSIAAVPGGDVWAVGATSTVALSVRLHNAVWTSVPVPAPAEGAGQFLLGVAGRSSTDVFAVGGKVLNGFYPVRDSVRWDGTQWVEVPAGDTTRLYGVAYDRGGNYWAVGENNGQSVIMRHPV